MAAPGHSSFSHPILSFRRPCPSRDMWPPQCKQTALWGNVYQASSTTSPVHCPHVSGHPLCPPGSSSPITACCQLPDLPSSPVGSGFYHVTLPFHAHWSVVATLGRAMVFAIYLRKYTSSTFPLKKFLQSRFSHTEDILITPAAIIHVRQL